MDSIFLRTTLALFGLVGGLAAQTIQASLVALQPLTITETGLGQVSHPAGPLTAAQLSLGSSTVDVDLTQTALGHNLECRLLTITTTAPQHAHIANTDLQLTVSASVPTRATLRIFSHCQEDGVGTVNIDVPGHGSIVFSHGGGIGSRHNDHFQVDLTSTPLPITITQSAGGPPPAYSFVSVSYTHLTLPTSDLV